MTNEFRCKVTYGDGTTHVFYTEEEYVGKHVMWLLEGGKMDIRQAGKTVEIRSATDDEREIMMRGI